MAMGNQGMKPSSIKVKLPAGAQPKKKATGGGGVRQGVSAAPATKLTSGQITQSGKSGGGPPAPKPSDADRPPLGVEQALRTGANEQTRGGVDSFDSTSGSNPYTGFAKQYSPTNVGNIFADPSILARDVLSQMGITNPTAAADAAPMAQAMQYLAGLLGMQNLNDREGPMINTWANLMESAFKPGGRTIDATEMLRMLLENPSAQTRGYLTGTIGATDPNQAALTSGEQFDALMPMLGAAFSGSNPFSQRAFKNVLSGLESQYMGSAAKGEMPGFAYQYVLDNLRNLLPNI